MDIFSAIFHGFNISRTPPVDTYLHIKKIYKGWCFVQTWEFLTRLTFASCGCTCSCNLWLLIISEWCSSLDTELRYNHRAKILLAFFRHLEAGNNRKPYTLNLVTTLRSFFTSPVLYLRLPQKNLATKRNQKKKKKNPVTCAEEKQVQLQRQKFKNLSFQEAPNAKQPDIEISLREARNTNIKTSEYAESQDKLVYNIVNFQ